MTFLNPALLLGLVAAAIPILLHLLNLRKLRTVEFSTLTFLKELQRTRVRRIKIRQLLLMLLRTLLVILLVLSFSRPTLKGSVAGSLGSHAKTSIILLIDDSYSMTAVDQDGELLKQARQSALSIIDLLKEGDEIAVVKFSEVGRGNVDYQPGFSRDPSLARRVIEELKSSPVHRKLADVIRLSAGLIAGSLNFNREIYILSDFQRGVVEQSSSSLRPESLFPPEVRFFLLPFGKKTLQNAGISEVTIPNAIFEQGKPFTVQARVRNASKESLSNHLVGLFLNGTRVAQRGVDVQRESASDADFTVTSNEAGFIDGFVELEEDDLEYDNKRFFTLHLPEQINVLLVGSEQETRFLQLALGTRQSGDGSVFRVQEIQGERLGATQIQGNQVIILVGPETLSPVQANHLAAFVAQGGGLILFPGSNGTADRYNAQLAPPMRLPLIHGTDGGTAQNPDAETESFVAFDKIDLRHPLFQGMFEIPGQTGGAQSRDPQRTVESPRITRSVRYVPSAQSNQIITLTNGSTFLLEHPWESGRILLFAVAPDLAWSDFPLKGLFVPLIHRSVSYVGGEHSTAAGYFAGDDVTIQSTIRTQGPWTVRNPASIDVTTAPATRGTQQSMRFRETESVGIYTVRAGTNVFRKFAVNLHPDESNTAPVPEADLEIMLSGMGIDPSVVAVIQQPRDAQRLVLESRFGVELWKHFLLAALVVALLEMAVARVGKDELTSVTP